MLRVIENKLKDGRMKIRSEDGYYYYHYVNSPNDENFLLECIRKDYYHDWRIINAVKYKDYIWWSYPNFKRGQFVVFARQLDIYRIEKGLPSNIIKIVEIINRSTYFNKQIRQFAWIVTWRHFIFIFIYYRRYYRYLANDRLFGKKNFLSIKNGHKLHFISYLKHREVTGHRLNKNHMVF